MKLNPFFPIGSEGVIEYAAGPTGFHCSYDARYVPAED